MEQLLVGYFLNSAWQLLLLAIGAWLLVCALRPTPQTQHRLWIALLPLALALPLLSLHPGSTATNVRPAPAPSPGPAVADLQVPTPMEGAALRLMPPESAPPRAMRLHREPVSPAIALSSPSLDEPSTVVASDPPAIQTPTPTSATLSTSTSTRLLHWPPTRELRLGPSTTRWIAGFYLATIAFALLRLLFALGTARRVLARSRPATLNPAQLSLLDQCCGRLGVPRPRVLESAAAHSPMVVGFSRPALLLPRGYADRPTESDHELEAVWLHELAHLRRGDSLANLICRLLAIPVAYHPATWAVEQRIRQTREMLCDAMAAAEMQSPTGYARCLVALARTMQIPRTMTAQFDGAAMFDGTSLEERVMQLIATRNTASLRTRVLRLACAASIILGVIAAAATFHVTPTLAHASTPQSPAPVAANATDQANQQLDEAREQFETGMRIASQAVSRAAYQGLRAGNLNAGRPFEYVQFQSAADRKEWNDALNESINASVRASIDAQMRANDLRISSADLKIALAQADNPEIQRQIAEAEARINSPEFKKQIEDAKAKFNSPEFKEQMKKFDSPEFKKQMEDARAKFDSPEFKEHMKKFDSPEFKKQMEDAKAKFNSPEFKKQMDYLNSEEFKKQFEIQKSIKIDQAFLNLPQFRRQIEELQITLESPAFRTNLDKLDSAELKKQLTDLNIELGELRDQLRKDRGEKIIPAPSSAPTPSVP